MRKSFLFIVMLFAFSCKQSITINKDYLPIKESEVYSNEYYQFVARGGERHLSQIDWGEESIPTSSKSCHHGGELIPPLKGFIQARHDNKNVYIKISWNDLTKDNKSSVWKGNRLIEGKDDGLSIIFSQNPAFNCALTCHMSNWEIESGRFVSDYRMYNDKEDNSILLIRPAKTGGKAIFGILGIDGKKNPHGSDFFIINSKIVEKKKSSFYLYQIAGKDNDVPLYEDHLLFIPSKDNVYLDSEMRYRLNEWTVYMAIPLSFLGLKEIKKNDKIYMSIAIFDGTQINHSITNTFLAKFE